MKTTPLAEKLPNTIDPNLDLEQVKKECIAMVKRRARISAGVAIVPVPFFDVAIDATKSEQFIQAQPVCHRCVALAFDAVV